MFKLQQLSLSLIHLQLLKNNSMYRKNTKNKLYVSVCLCARSQAEKTDGEITADFLLSLGLTAQTKTKARKFHDLDHNLLLLPLVFCFSACLMQKHLDPVKAVMGRRF